MSNTYDWNYLASKVWFRLLNVLAVVAALFVLVVAWGGSQGAPAYMGYTKYADGSGGICFPSVYQFCYQHVFPATPFNWDLFWKVIGGGGLIIWALWWVVVYVLAGSKVKHNLG